MYEDQTQPEVKATDIPTRHKVGIWGGGVTAIIALLLGIAALILALVYDPRWMGRWQTVNTNNSGSTVSIEMVNKTMFIVTPPSVTATTSDVTVSLSKGNTGDVFGIYSAASSVGVGVGNVVVTGLANGNTVSIPPGTAVQFVLGSNGIYPFYPADSS